MPVRTVSAIRSHPRPDRRAVIGGSLLVTLILCVTSAAASGGGGIAAEARSSSADTSHAVRAVQARVLRVGSRRALKAPSAAAAVVRDGDTVLIDAGTYPGDVATWRANGLTLRAVGGRVVLPARGRSAQGKAIWIVAGDRTRIEGITFTGARVPDRNGAGIRQEGAGLVVARSEFRGNENGILAGANRRSDIVIRDSRFIGGGAGDGYSHNLYIGDVRSLTVTGSVFAAAARGHELKSRAARNTIQGNLITDRDATASYSVDLPNGGAALIAGNVIIQGPRSENPALIAYGAEGLTHATRSLWVVNNTLVSRRTSGTFVNVAHGIRAEVRNNLLVGPGRLVSGSARSIANRRVTAAGFVAPAREDYRLRPTSPAVNRGAPVPVAVRALWEFVPPLGRTRRPVAGPADLGAYELRRVPGPVR